MGQFLEVLGGLLKGAQEAVALQAAGDEAAALAHLGNTVDETGTKIAKMFADEIERQKTIAKELADKNKDDTNKEDTKPE